MATKITVPEAPNRQLVSYIAHAAPATRRPARGDEPFIRPEIGFTPRWYHQALGLEFGEAWHTNPAYRADTIQAMARETEQRFGCRADLGILQPADNPVDLLTGTFGALLVPGLFGVPIWYQPTEWPWSEHGQHLSDDGLDQLQPPDFDNNPFWNAFMQQLDWIEKQTGRIEGFMNWQGVVNTAYRLRGEALFTDMIAAPARVHRLFECVTETMIEGIRRLYARQKASGVEYNHITISNCLVNMVSPRHYQKLVLPYDRHLAGAFSMIGVHNCAWNADPYVPHYETLPNVAYIDMGLESDLRAAKAAFPTARRALMYTPMDVANKSDDALGADLDRIAREYGPCDLVCADIDVDTTDARIHHIFDLCETLSRKYAA
jgi:hypothetical protein